VITAEVNFNFVQGFQKKIQKLFSKKLEVFENWIWNRFWNWTIFYGNWKTHIFILALNMYIGKLVRLSQIYIYIAWFILSGTIPSKRLTLKTIIIFFLIRHHQWKRDPMQMCVSEAVFTTLHFLRKSRMLPISKSVCDWQAFPA
jgi:hypothetical protein